MLITIYKCLNYDSFLNILTTCLLCVNLEEQIFYHYVNLLPLVLASTLFVTLQLRPGTPYPIM